MTSIARKFDITIEQGATFVFNLTYKDQSGNPVDLTGYDAYMQVRTKQGGPILLSATVANGKITTNFAGTVAVRIGRTETAGINIGFGVYDLFIRNTVDDTATKLLYGDVEIIQAVTRI